MNNNGWQVALILTILKKAVFTFSPMFRNKTAFHQIRTYICDPKIRWFETREKLWEMGSLLLLIKSPNGATSRLPRKTAEEIDVSLAPKRFNCNDCGEVIVLSTSFHT